LPSSPAFNLDLSKHRIPRIFAWVTIFAAAVVPAFITAAPLIVRILGAVSAVLLLVRSYRRAGWIHGPRSLQFAVWDADGRWFLSRAGKTWEARLRGDSWVSAHVLLLRWEVEEGSIRRTTVLLTPIDLGPVDFRRLLVRLRVDGMRAADVTDSLLA
jgi:hypothetical protein